MEHALALTIAQELEIASLLEDIADAKRRLGEIMEKNENERASLQSNCSDLRNQRDSLRSNCKQLTDILRGRHKGDGVHPSRKTPPAGQLERLTQREIEVLRLIAEGLNTKSIASRLGISFKTAVCHRSHILEKMNCHESASLVRLAMQAGLVS
ncbi:MAG: response regulator transcription factor [Bryobacterales bacterium]|nr:response regulator transcription factor [Bryobacterales bacterium]MBV9398517.1 response regulator transcription factor [Bryobacterales bacterium]